MLHHRTLRRQMNRRALNHTLPTAARCTPASGFLGYYHQPKATQPGYESKQGKVNLAFMTSEVNELDYNGAVRHRQVPAFSLGRSACPHTWTLDTAAMKLHAAPVCSIEVSTPIIHAITD